MPEARSWDVTARQRRSVDASSAIASRTSRSGGTFALSAAARRTYSTGSTQTGPHQLRVVYAIATRSARRRRRTRRRASSSASSRAYLGDARRCRCPSARSCTPGARERDSVVGEVYSLWSLNRLCRALVARVEHPHDVNDFDEQCHGTAETNLPRRSVRTAAGKPARAAGCRRSARGAGTRLVG